MKSFIFRNYTIEYLFGKDAEYSGYNNSFEYNENAERFFWFYLCPVRSSQSEIIIEIKDALKKLEIFLSKDITDRQIILFTIADITSLFLENSYNELEKVINEYNEALYSYSQKKANIAVVDIKKFYQNYDHRELVNWKFFYFSQMVINPKFKNDFQEWLVSQLESIQNVRKKCLVLDLDNTLWGGVLGEEGIHGIKIGEDYPGNVYLEFQRSLLEVSRNGIILAVCSKNNKEDVFEVWEKNENIVLRKEHFSSYRINWENKADNIREIAAELNIGTDSIVFLDDNPVERELVNKILPEVAVPDFPQKEYEITPFFRQVCHQYFQIYRLSQEDLAKSEQYQASQKRNEAQKSASDIEQYYKDLETVITILPLSESNISRMAQMSNKTNQFNLTTKRYTESDIQKFSGDGNLGYCLKVEDKFGNSGITGMILLEIQNDQVTIDSLLLSCRVLGRKIEFAFVRKVLNILLEKGIRKVRASFIPTAKNKQVEDFYDRLGFQLLEKEETKAYCFKLEKQLELDPIIKVNYDD